MTMQMPPDIDNLIYNAIADLSLPPPRIELKRAPVELVARIAAMLRERGDPPAPDELVSKRVLEILRREAAAYSPPDRRFVFLELQPPPGVRLLDYGTLKVRPAEVQAISGAISARSYAVMLTLRGGATVRVELESQLGDIEAGAALIEAFERQIADAL